jgi:hypothetical protein
MLAAIIAVHNYIYPPDWVFLRVTDIPRDVKSLYVIVQGSDGVRPLRWYVSKFFPWVEDARHGQFGQFYPPHPPYEGEKFGDVEWKVVDRYGILAKQASGRWVVWWLNPHDVVQPTRLRYLIGGKVEATIHVLGIERATPAPESLIAQVTGGP